MGGTIAPSLKNATEFYPAGELTGGRFFLYLNAFHNNKNEQRTKKRWTNRTPQREIGGDFQDLIQKFARQNLVTVVASFFSVRGDI